MTDGLRAELSRKLKSNGLTVVKTGDYESMLLQLARLARFQRIMLATAAGNPVVEVAVEHVRQQTDQPESDRRRPPLERLDPACRMEIDDIPRVLRIAHAGLHNYLAQDASLLDPAAVPELIDGALEIARSGLALHNAVYIRTGLVNATVAALVGVISVDRVCEAGS